MSFFPWNNEGKVANLLSINIILNSHNSVYGAVALNNLLGLGIFLFMIYLNPSLHWNFSAESTVIILAIMGKLMTLHIIPSTWQSLLIENP